MRFTVGTSTLIGLPTAFMGALIYMLLSPTQLKMTSVTIGYLHWPAFFAITSAGLICTPLGVRLSTLLHPQILQRLFSVLIMFIGLKMFPYY